ncbi:MAG: LON peptidase substrate-binding domain-containing protein [Planctomycetota bacterium]|nr:LON peptidase substrate-binding domain-containing protein [Planctomycetota bacterium]
MSDSTSIDFDLPIAVFPLPQCVLLPHATVPLHIFEPRYRRMVSDALEGGRAIAMATFEGDDWKRDYEGKPPLRPTVCVAVIARHQELPDGRWNILLRGICRARIVREMPHDPYRVARLRPTEDEPEMEIDLIEHRRRLEDLLCDADLRRVAAVHSLQPLLRQETSTAAMIDLSIMCLVEDSEQRYAMLAEADAQERAGWLERRLEETRKVVVAASRRSTVSGVLEVTLN